MSVIKNRTSPEWVAVKNFCETRIARLREDNDRPQPVESTERLRGMIAFAKVIMELDKEDPVIEANDTNYLT